LPCVKFDAYTNPDRRCTGFDCRPKKNRLVAAKHRSKLALHLVETGQRCRFRTVPDKLNNPPRPNGGGELRRLGHLNVLKSRLGMSDALRIGTPSSSPCRVDDLRIDAADPYPAGDTGEGEKQGSESGRGLRPSEISRSPTLPRRPTVLRPHSEFWAHGRT
jgi:hypothetical protein